MKLFLLIIISVLYNNNNLNAQVDTSVITLLSYEKNNHVLKHRKSSSLTADDYAIIEEVLSATINAYNIEQKKNFLAQKSVDAKISEDDYLINLLNYKRQYIIVENIKGEKEVYINFFCQEWSDYSRNNLVVAYDGGNCYFRLIINLSNKKTFGMLVNGDA
ncbi:MAG: hypothetical protein IR153_03905 [Flavobacterium sp.]|nr:hypothetical protein [Flavobacterium sp.]